jgi:hypothetical protein
MLLTWPFKCYFFKYFCLSSYISYHVIYLNPLFIYFSTWKKIICNTCLSNMNARKWFLIFPN